MRQPALECCHAGSVETLAECGFCVVSLAGLVTTAVVSLLLLFWYLVDLLIALAGWIRRLAKVSI